eukprot:g942.t1
MDIEEELNLNYCAQVDGDNLSYEDSLEAEFALNYEACEHIENLCGSSIRSDISYCEKRRVLTDEKSSSGSTVKHRALADSTTEYNPNKKIGVCNKRNMWSCERPNSKCTEKESKSSRFAKGAILLRSDNSKEEIDEDPLLDALQGGNEENIFTKPLNAAETNKKRTPRSGKRRKRLSSISPGAVLPHYELKDPLVGIFGEDDEPCAVTRAETSISTAGITPPCSRIGMVTSSPSPSPSRKLSNLFIYDSASETSFSSRPSTAKSDRDGTDNNADEEDTIWSTNVHATEALRLLIGATDFLACTDKRYRNELDMMVGSKRIFVTSAAVFDVVCQRSMYHLEQIECESNDGRIAFKPHHRRLSKETWTRLWQRFEDLLEALIDVEVHAMLYCADITPCTMEDAQSRRVRFRSFDLSSVHMPNVDNAGAVRNFERLLHVIQRAIGASKYLMDEYHFDKATCGEKKRESQSSDARLLVQSFVRALKEFEAVHRRTRSAHRTHGGLKSALKGRRDKNIDDVAAAAFVYSSLFPKAVAMTKLTRCECARAASFFADELSNLVESGSIVGSEQRYPLQSVASRLLESLVRYSLRCCLNYNETVDGAATMTMVANTGSLCFNDYDLAAVVNRALQVVSDHESSQKSEKIPTSLLDSIPVVGDVEEDNVESYLGACSFIVTLFSEPVLFKAAKDGTGQWKYLKSALTLAVACGCEQRPSLVKFARLIDMDSFFSWICDEKASTERTMTLLNLAAEEGLSSKQKKKRKKKKKKKRRRRRSLSGSSRRRQKKGESNAWQFPRLKIAEMGAKTYAKEGWLCTECERPVLNYNEGGEIACDGCGAWSHLKCLGLPENHPLCVESFHCKKCEAKSACDESL